MREFAGEVERLRLELGLTSTELAHRAGVSRSYLRDLVLGRRGQGLPSEHVIGGVARALGVQADHFRLTRARVVLNSPRAIDAVYAKLQEARKAS